MHIEHHRAGSAADRCPEPPNAHVSSWPETRVSGCRGLGHQAPERCARLLQVVLAAGTLLTGTVPVLGAQRAPQDIAGPATPSRSAPAAGSDAAQLDSLIAAARKASPALRAARARVEAARSRIAPAGARPDPMLMAGIQNFPVTEPGFTDFMTMKMVGVGQTIPFPGKLPLRTRAAERELAAAHARLDDAEL